jgi:hypothetical protein
VNEPKRATFKPCAYCGTLIARGDGGIRAHGALYCSEDCADEHELEATRGGYAEDPLGGSWS